MKRIYSLIIILSLMVGFFIFFLSRNSPRTAAAQASPGDLALKPCRVKSKAGRIAAECGQLIVPENRHDPHSRSISLPLTRIPATGDKTGEPVFHLTGGPGLSNMAFQPSAELLSEHDIVLVGYRGVDGSVTLDCPEVSRAMKGAGGNLFGEASQAAIGQAIQDCAGRLQAGGIDLAGYTIQEVIADLETARGALGYERINLLSESYGTRVALLYAQQHPERIYRSVMVGVNPPGRFVWEAEKIDEQIERYSRLCAADPGCSARTKDLAETIRAVNRAMPRRWLTLPIDSGKVRAASFALLFNQNTAAMVFDAYLATEAGDPSGLALLSLAYDFALPNMFTWGDFMTKGFSSDFDSSRDYTRLAAPETIMGSPLSLLFWPHATRWPIPTLPEDYRRVQPSEVETLLISGSQDFSTPAEYASDELLPYLEKGQQLVRAELGHTGDLWGAEPEAMNRLLAEFYKTGEADSARFTYQPVDFDPGWMSLPRLAKILAGALALGLVALVAVVVKGYRLIKDRNTRRAGVNWKQRAPARSA